MSKLYFCYSSSLDTAAFEEWKRGHGYEFFSLPQGKKARLLGYEYQFNLFSNYWGGRVLGLEKNSKKEVEGIVFEIKDQDWPIIEHKEGLKTGLSQMISLSCLVNGQEVTAFAFTTPESRKTTQGPLSQRFLDLIKRSHEKWGLVTDFDGIC